MRGLSEPEFEMRLRQPIIGPRGAGAWGNF